MCELVDALVKFTFREQENFLEDGLMLAMAKISIYRKNRSQGGIDLAVLETKVQDEIGKNENLRKIYTHVKEIAKRFASNSQSFIV